MTVTINRWLDQYSRHWTYIEVDSSYDQYDHYNEPMILAIGVSKTDSRDVVIQESKLETGAWWEPLREQAPDLYVVPDGFKWNTRLGRWDNLDHAAGTYWYPAGRRRLVHRAWIEPTPERARIVGVPSNGWEEVVNSG